MLEKGWSKVFLGLFCSLCAEEDAEEGFEAYEGLVCRGSSIMEENEFDRVRRELGNSRCQLCETLGGEGMNEGVIERTRRDCVNSVFSVGS